MDLLSFLESVQIPNSWRFACQVRWCLPLLCGISALMIDQYTYLVGGLEHDFCFSHHIGNVIPTDEVHHFSEGLNQYHQPDTPCDCGSPQPDPLLGPQNIFIKNPTVDFLQNMVPWIQNSISIYFLGCIQKLPVGFPSTKTGSMFAATGCSPLDPQARGSRYPKPFSFGWITIVSLMKSPCVWKQKHSWLSCAGFLPDNMFWWNLKVNHFKFLIKSGYTL